MSKNIVHQLYTTGQFTEWEKQVALWQLDICGDWTRMLIQFACKCDVQNRAKLAKGFPGAVAAVESWTQGDLAKRLQDFGLKV